MTKIEQVIQIQPW